MNVIGEKVSVLDSDDPGKVGRSGVILLETEKTLLVDDGRSRFRLEKEGTVFQLSGSGVVVAGGDIAGRLEDRLGRSH